MKTGRHLLVAAALACALSTAQAAAPSLEDAFWACDYIATTRGTAAAPGATCTAVYEEFKARKFDGDFQGLLAWWQANKPEAHARIAESIATIPEHVLSVPAVALPAKPSRAVRLLAATRAYFSEVAGVLRDD